MTTRVQAWAPGRINLIGEHTDYNSGLCLPVALSVGTSVRATRRSDDRFQIRSAQQAQGWSGALAEAGPGSVAGWAAYATGVLWALAEAGHDVPGMDLELDGSVPLGAGLSSSASLEAAVAVAAVAMAGRTLDDDLRRELVAVCRRAETEAVGAPTGGLDQTAVLLAAPATALLLDFADDSVRRLTCDPEAADLALVVVDTRVTHAHSDGDYGSRRAECEAAAAALGVASLREVPSGAVDSLEDDVLRRRARHIVTENARVTQVADALERGDWSTVGGLFTESHHSMRDDFEISCPELDLVVQTSLEAGALGARMTGGGFGGSAIVLVRSDGVPDTQDALTGAFERAGLVAPAFLDGSPAAGASITSA